MYEVAGAQAGSSWTQPPDAATCDAIVAPWPHVGLAQSRNLLPQVLPNITSEPVVFALLGSPFLSCLHNHLSWHRKSRCCHRGGGWQGCAVGTWGIGDARPPKQAVHL